MTIHQARKNNASDVQAKDNSQETLVGLVGLFLSYFIVDLVGENPTIVISLFLTFTVLHLVCNYFAVRSVSQELFNLNRLRIAVRHFAEKNSVLSVDEVNDREPILSKLPNCSNILIGIAIEDSYEFVLEFGGAVLSKNTNEFLIY